MLRKNCELYGDNIYIHFNANEINCSKNDLPSSVRIYTYSSTKYSSYKWVLNNESHRDNDLLSVIEYYISRPHIIHTIWHHKFNKKYRYTGWAKYFKDRYEYKFTKGICCELLKESLNNDT